MKKIRQLQLKELELLKTFVDICEKNGLRYFLLGGTLLGAVRHKGFIPWDDDVDVAMPRSDYEKFLEIASRDLNEPYYIDNYSISPAYRYAFARMSDKSMQVCNCSAIKPRIEDISIDVIPLDGFPDLGIKRIIHKMRLGFWWILNQIIQFDELVDQKRKRSIVGTLLVKLAGIFKWIGHFWNYRVCFEHITKLLKKYPYDSGTNEIINFVAPLGFKEIFPRQSFGKGKWYSFEELKFVGPEDYDCVCKILYGDYMKIPPKEQQNKHNTEIV